MRLSKKICQIIKSSINESFGDANIYLFGSRTDNSKLGGDIDIAIETTCTKEEFRKNKIKFFTSLIKKDFDLKIDLIRYKKDGTLISKEIEKNKIQL